MITAYYSNVPELLSFKKLDSLVHSISKHIISYEKFLELISIIFTKETIDELLFYVNKDSKIEANFDQCPLYDSTKIIWIKKDYHNEYGAILVPLADKQCFKIKYYL